jgi:hypothetical protein
MNSADPTPIRNQRWRWMSLLFLGLLPVFMLFHLVMYFGFTRTLFRPETGDLKRMGYLVSDEDRKEALRTSEPKSGFELLTDRKQFENRQVPVMMFGDSFSPSLARAYSLRTGQPVGLGEVIWGQGNGLSQIKAWLTDPWFAQHGVKTIVVERVECAWLDTFADEGDPGLNISWEAEQNGADSKPYVKATAWTFANNGNFKVLFCNLAYLVSPTALKMTDTCVVRLKQKFFDCSYGNELLFYRGDLRGALNEGNKARLDAGLKHLQELSDLCHQHGMNFHLVVPPVKSFLYYDWVEHPFYPDSQLLEALQARATASGYVDVKQRLHHELEGGYQDLYYPDDSHWNFPAAEMAADELAKAQKTP